MGVYVYGSDRKRIFTESSQSCGLWQALIFLTMGDLVENRCDRVFLLLDLNF
jgi:hypothetical protein